MTSTAEDPVLRRYYRMGAHNGEQSYMATLFVCSKEEIKQFRKIENTRLNNLKQSLLTNPPKTFNDFVVKCVENGFGARMQKPPIPRGNPSSYMVMFESYGSDSCIGSAKSETEAMENAISYILDMKK